MNLTDIKGVGPKTRELFERLGIHTPEDLLRYYPAGYDLCASPVPAGEVRAGEKCSVCGRVVRDCVLRRYAKLTILTTVVEDYSGQLRVTWYNAPYLSHMLKRGSLLVFRGIVREKKDGLAMDQPEVYTSQKYAEIENVPIPVYGLTKGLTGKTIAKAVKWLMEEAPSLLEDYLPADFARELGLPEEGEALRQIHFPENEAAFAAARSRLVFDEFFLFIMALRTLKSREERVENAFPMKKTWECEDVIGALPFTLTAAQLRVWREIEADLASEGLMNRLLQGDVGSGKTIIAFLAMIMAAANGYQAALMAPTEVLAAQHCEKLLRLAEKLELPFLKAALLTGSIRGARRREILEGIRSGEITLVIGTHAILEETVEFRNLSLVITDEQHRFGVRQRGTLLGRGRTPHALIMSATPIPRTLGVIYFGDLSISTIDERPAKRLRIKNAVVDGSWRPKAVDFIRKQVEEGRQAYVICPMIEPSEGLDAASVTEEGAALAKELPEQRVAILHGQMKAEEKTAVMEAFLKGEIDVLVSTTVVEVGVDVPNATVMLIENAERFGLAQLHQLRGRVGRGDAQSYCIFMAGQKSPLIEERLGVLRDTDDGFVIAEKDFALRGPGDLLGIRQSGDAAFRLADVTRDAEILKKAGRTADMLFAEDPEQKGERFRRLWAALDTYLQSNEQNFVM